MRVNLGIEINKIKPEFMKEALIKSAIFIVNDAKANCKIDTGRLAGSIAYAIEGMPVVMTGQAKASDAIKPKPGGMYAKIGTNVNYAIDVEYGTKAHEIKPANGGVLVFKTKDGETVFTKKTIKHPGTKRQPFLRPAFFNNIKNIKEIFKKALKKSIEV
jgi:HK97 gp10 family phage protein